MNWPIRVEILSEAIPTTLKPRSLLDYCRRLANVSGDAISKRVA